MDDTSQAIDQQPLSKTTSSTDRAGIAETELDAASQPFIGQWNELVSTTNWDKGRIIFDWREALVEAAAPAVEYSDEAWSRRVGNVTGQHVGRLRRVYERFGTVAENYDGLYWSHFQAALDWDDAEMWLEGAVQSSWSVSIMRRTRWETLGAVEADRPRDEDIVAAETDEDVEPSLDSDAASHTSSSGDNVPSGPLHEGPDFGDEDEAASADQSGAEPGASIMRMTTNARRSSSCGRLKI